MKPQKPHLKRIQALWYCGVRPRGAWVSPVGVGFTPAQAYADWVERL